MVRVCGGVGATNVPAYRQVSYFGGKWREYCKSAQCNVVTGLLQVNRLQYLLPLKMINALVT